MDQFRPCGEYGKKAGENDRGITAAMLAEAQETAQRVGLHRFEQRDLSALLKRLFRNT